MATKTYLQLKIELDKLMEWFDREDIDIDMAVNKYEQAVKLLKQLENHLLKAENKITKLSGE
ncbi:exodeoxyribonuclease VII small subunit [Candidatus Saccharibacteria bacterium]|nr:exodeoxyribonuclease VII small subunit [Candidatus Saccharibacteria bacterium]